MYKNTPCQCGAPVVAGTCTGSCFSQPLDAAAEGTNYVSYVPALVLPMGGIEADNEAGTDAGTKTSTYEGLRGVALMRQHSRKEAVATLLEVAAGAAFIILMWLAWLGTN